MKLSSAPERTKMVVGKPVIIDTDPGIDDAFAILYLLGVNRTNIIGLTTTPGNGELELVTRNALSILELAGRSDVPVAQTIDIPSIGGTPLSRYVHGLDALGNVPRPSPHGKPVQLPAVEFIAEALEAHPEGITILALGPLTNIALLCKKFPHLVNRIESLILMGGSFGSGNVTPYAEFNIWSNPEAAAEVFSAGIATTVLPLETTRHFRLPSSILYTLPAGPVADFLVSLNDIYADAEVDASGERVTIQHDLAAAMYLASPGLFEQEILEGGVQVDCSTGPYRGRMTVGVKASGNQHIRAVLAREAIVDWQHDLMRGLNGLINSTETSERIISDGYR